MGDVGGWYTCAEEAAEHRYRYAFVERHWSVSEAMQGRYGDDGIRSSRWASKVVLNANRVSIVCLACGLAVSTARGVANSIQMSRPSEPHRSDNLLIGK